LNNRCVGSRSDRGCRIGNLGDRNWRGPQLNSAWERTYSFRISEEDNFDPTGPNGFGRAGGNLSSALVGTPGINRNSDHGPN